MTEETTKDKNIGYIFSLTANLGSERQFSIQGNLPMNVTKEALNAELDKLCQAIDRQQSISAISAIEDQVRKMRVEVDMQTKDLEEFDSKQAARANGKLPQNEQNAVHNIRNNILRLKEEIRAKEELLDKTRKEAA